MSEITKQEYPVFTDIVEHDHKIVQRICCDDEYAYDFFYRKCQPLLSKIIWTIYDNNVDYDELVNTLYEYLKAPDSNGMYWHRLLTFNYRTSLFDWIKIVATRLFYVPTSDFVSIPESMIESGMAEQMFSEIDKSESRKYFKYKYIQSLSDSEIANKLQILPSEIKQLSRRSVKLFKNLLHEKYPEYYNIIIKSRKSTEKEQKLPEEVSTSDSESIEIRFDIDRYLQAMPNHKYKLVIKSLFIDELTPEELSEKLCMPISNVYNLKSRAIDQLRDLAISFHEIEHIDKYINLISDDRKRFILYSIFIEKKDYTEMCNNLGISEAKFRKLKKDALKDIRNIIFKNKI